MYKLSSFIILGLQRYKPFTYVNRGNDGKTMTVSDSDKKNYDL